MEKGGGYFERVRSVQTTLTGIFIDLEAVSNGLSEIWDEISRKARKFKDFFRPKSGGLQKKKKVFPKIESDFSAKFRNLKVFSAQNQVISKKKIFTDIETDFSSNFENSDVWGGLFSNGGGYFPFFSENRPQKHKKHAILHTSQANGGLEPPAPPPLSYATAYNY